MAKPNKVDEAIRLAASAFSSILNPGKTKKKLPKIESGKYPEIYVFRHGETFDNKNKVFSGWRDSKITAKGKKQAKTLADKLKNKQIEVCIISSLSRSKDTAKIVFKGKKVKFEVDDRIIERNYGKLSGKSKSKLTVEDPIKAVKYRRFFDYPPPGGESGKMVKKRIFDFCDELVERVRKEGINVALSTHGNSMKMIRLYFEKLPLIEVLAQENPLGKDYAEYVVTPKKVLVSRVPS
jgi:2,3-bisphosphoglycerate-dependent phosphoglycerate mutase